MRILQFYAKNIFHSLFHLIMSGKSENLDIIIPKLIETVRYATAISVNDISFYRTMDGEIDTMSSQSSDRLLEILRSLAFLKDEHSSLALKANLRAFWDDFESNIDTIYEKVDIALEKHDPNLQIKSHGSILSSKSIRKPQIDFDDKVDNSEAKPFRPKLRSKPFSIRLLEDLLVTDPIGRFEQPYQHEIMAQKYPDWIFEERTPSEPHDWDSRPATFVTTTDQLMTMISTLKASSSIAVDLEHHDLRSYYGLTCLMQISDRNQDWLVDVLALRSEVGSLNEVFANPNIIKVFHGAFMDIIWLQRDLGLYIVSLFDTYHAAKQLGYPKLSLAYLLERFAGFKASKKYQLADWRIRPLPPAMARYARADTHFLLNIFDHLRNSLIGEGGTKLEQVLYSSRKVASRKFEYPKFSDDQNEFDESSYIIRNYNVPFKLSNRLQLLVTWRDLVARELDESTRYILPNSAMIQVLGLETPISHSSVSRIAGINVSGRHLDSLVKLMNDSKENTALKTATSHNSQELDERLCVNKSSLDAMFRFQQRLLPLDAVGICSTSSMFNSKLLNSLTFRENFQRISSIEGLKMVPFADAQSSSLDHDDASICQDESNFKMTDPTYQEQSQKLLIGNIRGVQLGGQVGWRSRRDVARPVALLDYEEALEQNKIKASEKSLKRRPQFDPLANSGGKNMNALKKRRLIKGKSAAFTK